MSHCCSSMPHVSLLLIDDACLLDQLQDSFNSTGVTTVDLLMSSRSQMLSMYNSNLSINVFSSVNVNQVCWATIYWGFRFIKVVPLSPASNKLSQHFMTVMVVVPLQSSPLCRKPFDILLSLADPSRHCCSCGVLAGHLVVSVHSYY